MFGFIEREQILLKQNIYDLLHNTRIGKKAFLFIFVGVFFIYVLGNIHINREATYDLYSYPPHIQKGGNIPYHPAVFCLIISKSEHRIT